MKCPSCGNPETKVANSRTIEDGQWVRRRRYCEECENRFTTFEKIWITDLIIVKKDNSKQLYDRDKIKKALMLAFAKRQITVNKIENIISSLELKWISKGNEISSSTIWEDILEKLKDIDPVAYIRFASVYKNFENTEDFKQIISPIEKNWF